MIRDDLEPGSPEWNYHLKQVLTQLMLTLLPIEERVLRLHYGFFGEPQVIPKIATALGMPTYQVANIKYRALRKLQHPKQNALLRKFMGWCA